MFENGIKIFRIFFQEELLFLNNHMLYFGTNKTIFFMMVIFYYFVSVKEMVKRPYETRSDSFYFVNNELVMHNKADYAYDGWMESMIFRDVEYLDHHNLQCIVSILFHFQYVSCCAEKNIGTFWEMGFAFFLWLFLFLHIQNLFVFYLKDYIYTLRVY